MHEIVSHIYIFFRLIRDWLQVRGLFWYFIASNSILLPSFTRPESKPQARGPPLVCYLQMLIQYIRRHLPWLLQPQYETLFISVSFVTRHLFSHGGQWKKQQVRTWATICTFCGAHVRVRTWARPYKGWRSYLLWEFTFLRCWLWIIPSYGIWHGVLWETLPTFPRDVNKLLPDYMASRPIR
jgi:hypothetical protein